MVDFARDMGDFLKAVGKEFRPLLGILGLTILRFWKPLYGRDIPNSVFWLGVGVCLYFAVFFAWRKEHKNALLGSAFWESLKARCNELVLELGELAEDYQNSHKEEGQPTTLPEPMAPWWVSSGYKVWPYRVGRLQSSVIALRRDLKRTPVRVEDYDVRISVSGLLGMLRTYKEQIH